ncbi:MAG TPA: phosphotransferase [Streptosporangiaceae bacterium]|nr:phosphotransferase [Streptosporangiaceae bacterium]
MEARFDPAIRAAFGPARRLADVRRLAGGSKKGVYRLAFDDGFSAVGYLWDQGENWWPAASRPAAYDPRTDPFSDASGVGLFEAAHSLLTGLGVRVPELYLLDGDLALVEHVRGGTLEERLRLDAPGADDVMARLAAALELMHGCRSDGFGKVGFTGVTGSCEQVVLDRALEHLAEAAESVPRIAAALGAISERLRELRGQVEDRRCYRLIHGELGPDHVLVDAGRPVLVDIEGLMFFDIEWEHAFLELRFSDHYRWLRRDDLDPHRLRLYRLALSLSLVAGPMRLADSDYPERAFMIEIAEFNADRVLSLCS